MTTPTPKTAPEDHAVAVSLETERKKFEQWCDEELPQFFSGRQPTWSTVEANVKLHCWEAWQAALASQPLSGQQREEARALEFAEYMAKGAEQFIEAVNRYGKAMTEITEESELEAAEDGLTEFGRGLRADIYEFRKRRDRLSASPVAMPDEGKAVAPACDAKWLPIETAPKDGRTVFVVRAFDVAPFYAAARNYTSDPWCVMQDEKGRFLRRPHRFDPTHWMPLPQASSAQERPRQPEPAPDVLAMAEEAKQALRAACAAFAEDDDSGHLLGRFCERLIDRLAAAATHTQEGDKQS